MPAKYIGIDIGGTKIYGARYNSENWSEEQNLQLDTQKNFDQVLTQVEQMISKLKDKDTQAVGLGIPGYVSHEENKIYHIPNLKLNEPMDLNNRFELPVSIENDATLFAFAEQQINFPETKYLVGLTYGTGIGGGLIIDGQIYRGAQGTAGEFGRIYIEKDVIYEDRASGTAQKNLYGETGENIVQACHAGDPTAKDQIKELSENMGRGLINIIQALNPEVIVLGGAVMNHFHDYIDGIQNFVQKNTPEITRKTLHIEKSTIKNAGSLGAAILAFKKHK